MAIISIFLVASLLLSAQTIAQSFCEGEECRDCIQNSCGYDCEFASVNHVVCNACTKACESLGPILGNEAKISIKAGDEVTDTALCPFNPHTMTLYNECIVTYRPNGQNTALFMKCDASTAYFGDFYHYNGADCEGRPSQITRNGRFADSQLRCLQSALDDPDCQEKTVVTVSMIGGQTYSDQICLDGGEDDLFEAVFGANTVTLKLSDSTLPEYSYINANGRSVYEMYYTERGLEDSVGGYCVDEQIRNPVQCNKWFSDLRIAAITSGACEQ